MTELTPKELFEQRNSDNIFAREVIAGMLKILNRKVVYTQIWNDSENKAESVTVPFFFDFGEHNNSEKFIQDNYTFFGDDDCTEIGLKKISGNFDIYPRGILALSSSSINSGNITNRFVMGRYNKKVDGEIKSFVSFLYSIPLDFTFKLEVRCETLTTMFKIEEAFRKYFYKNKTFYINYNGTRVPVRCGMGESFTNDKGQNYTMGQFDTEKYFKLTMDLSVETYQPVFDPTTEMPADCSVSNWNSQINMGNVKNPSKTLNFINRDFENSILPSGTDIFLEWDYSYDNADSGFYELTYIDNETKEETCIESCISHNFYNWVIPSDLSGLSSQIDIIIPNTDDLLVYKNPEIKITPDPETKIISKESITVIGKGYFITGNKQVDGMFSYLNSKTGELSEFPFTLNLLNNQIDTSDPISFAPFVYTEDMNPKNIDLLLRDLNDSSICDSLKNITII